MSAGKAEFLAGLSGGIAFLVTLIIFGLPWWLSLALAFMIYGGLNLTLGGVVEDKVREFISGTDGAIAQLKQQIEKNQNTCRIILQHTHAIENRAIREKVANICEVADKIFENFEQDPDDIRQAHRFLSHFQKLLPIVENYAHLSSDPDRRTVLTAEDEQIISKTFDEFLASLKEAYRAFQENNVQQLRMATGTLKRMIDLDKSIKQR